MVNLKRTRDDILASVLDLTHHQSFHATGLKELLAPSGTSSGSFYNYFRSKDELAHALIDYKWEQITQNVIIPAQKATPDPVQQLLKMFELMEANHLAEPNCGGCFLGNLIVELATYDESFQHHLMRVFDEWRSAIAVLLHAAQPQLRADVDPQILADQLLTFLEGILLMGRLYNNPTQLKTRFTYLRQLLQSALKEQT
jgi:TetR/AcrR family transcriptional regulator, transcriptional repressor for nem operon